MQQSNFPTNLRRSGYLTRRNNVISWKLSGEIRAGYLGVLVRYAGLERLRWVRKTSMATAHGGHMQCRCIWSSDAMITDTNQPCISIRDLEIMITEIYLNFINLDTAVTLDFVIGQLTTIRTLVNDAGASSTAVAADDMVRLCQERNAEKQAILHGGLGQ